MPTYAHPDPIEVRTEQARKLLTAVMAGQDGHLVVSTFKPGVTSRSFTADKIESAIAFAMKQSGDKCVYFGTGLRERAFNGPGSRGTRGEISSIAVLWTEIDWFDPAAHKKGADKLPPDREAALAIIEAFPLKPTGVIESGHGFHVWWILAEPLIITNDVTRQAAITFVREFQHAFNGAAKDNWGYVLDSTEDIARVMRVPGTINWKVQADPKPVRMLSWEADVRYIQADIPRRPASGRGTAGGQGKAGKGNTGNKKKNKSPRVGGLADDQYGPADLDRILEGCGFMAHVRDDAAVLSRAEWLPAAGIVGRCVGGKARFHEMSRPYADYDEGETNDILDTALDAGPIKCSTIRGKFGDAYCGTCPFWGGIATPLELGRRHDGTPINTSFGDLPEQTAKAWTALFQENSPPTTFRMIEGLVRLDRDTEGTLTPVVMKVDHLTHRIARAAPWERSVQGGGRKGTVPPVAVIRDMMVQPSPPLPLLVGVTEVPVFSTDGELQQREGYSPATKRYLDGCGLVVPTVPKHPSPKQVKAAVALITDELIGDFPFVGAADRANALAAALLPFGRDFIDGPTPLHLVNKPIQGTGASLLGSVLLLPACGSTVPTCPQSENEAEWRKAITTALLPMPTALLLDNLTGTISSAQLSSMLTARNWFDRILGGNIQARVRINAVFMATANNAVLSGELSRRSIEIRLDAKTDRPWQREVDFRHPLIHAWALEHRGELVAALLTIWSAWVAEGRPSGTQTLGSYEAWAMVMGGVLDVARVPGFIDNLENLYERADAEGAAQREFVDAWWSAFSSQKVNSSDLVDEALRAGLPLGRREDLYASALGSLLKSLVDRRYTVEDANSDTEIDVALTATMRSRKNVWRLVRV